MVSALVYITACSICNLLSLACFMRGAAWCDDMGMDKTWGNLSIDRLYSYSSFSWQYRVHIQRSSTQ